MLLLLFYLAKGTPSCPFFLKKTKNHPDHSWTAEGAVAVVNMARCCVGLGLMAKLCHTESGIHTSTERKKH